MEILREFRVEIEKDSNKSTVKVCLELGEYDEYEGIEEFIERVSEQIRVTFLG